MGFTSGAKNLYDIVDDIADGLIASSASWEEGDATLDTTDRTNGQEYGSRCLKYTGDSADIWFLLTVGNYSTSVYSTTYFAKGLRITMSSSWDAINHEPPAGAMYTYISFEQEANAQATADLASLQLTYYLWIDEFGFCIMAKPEPFAADAHQESFFCSLERVPTKEYSDGYSNFFLTSHCNIWSSRYHTSYPDTHRHSCYLRFPNVKYPTSTTTASAWNHGVSLPPIRYYAFKSNGNGKVYYVKPVYHNTVDCMTPIAQANNWFYWSEIAGLVDGDIVAIDGETTKYLCKSLDSPNNTNRLTYAIKYVA